GVGRAVAFARSGGQASMRRLARDPRWEAVIAVAPDTAVGQPIWPRGLRRVPQGRGDLGARMQRMLDRMPPGPVVVVGTDIPRIRPAHVAQAFGLLGRADAVLGPAGDGGYWLVGLSRRRRRLTPFGRVRWSSPDALSDTLANLARSTVLLAATLEDVDDAAGLKRDALRIGRLVLPAG
ncbi:MAG: DUF2064 domain-containing protein, partial [Hyphomicrobiaceae bacterium]|nr:DUF2064 domain-containing protein [Hyphomicrobiaceae bacterium]